jgi:hypothetical protein
LLLVVDPVATWERIIRAQRSVPFILFAHLLPLLALAGFAEGFELATWGYKDRFGFQRPLGVTQVVVFEVVQALALLLLMLGAAMAVKGMGETFNARKTFAQALTVVAYGFGPVFLLRVFLVIPAFQPWMRWLPFVAGILLSLAVLYHGVPRAMALDPTNAFGLYLTTVFIMILSTGAVYLSAFLYLGNRALSTG